MRRNAIRVLTAALLAVLPAQLVLAGCAQKPVESAAEHQSLAGPTPPARAVVPQAASLTVGEVDKLFAAAGLVPILRYQPGVLSGLGTVVATDPPAGAILPAGDAVNVLVAGPPGPTLHDYVDAHRETFVGMAADGNGVVVVGINQQADLTKEIETLGRLANGTTYRIQTCPRTWTDLQRIQLELGRRDFVPGAEKLGFAMAIDPLACAVRLTIDLSEPDIAQLTARYQGALVIQKGGASRAG
jgi:phage gp37-like protein